VAPWDLARKPIYWRDWALALRAAEASAQAEAEARAARG
jgi:hypothetical protein